MLMLENIFQKKIMLERKKESLLAFLNLANCISIKYCEINFTQFDLGSYEKPKWDKHFSENLDCIIDTSISELEALGSSYLKPEHLLLAILKGKNEAKYLLTQLNINLSDLVNILETSILDMPNCDIRTDDFCPFSKEVIDLIDLASIESEKLSFKIYSRQSNNITTNDILLAVVKKKNSRTGILLNQVGLSYSIIRNKIIDNQHPFGLRSFKKIEKSIISRINTIDGKSAQCDHPNPV